LILLKTFSYDLPQIIRLSWFEHLIKFVKTQLKLTIN